MTKMICVIILFLFVSINSITGRSQLNYAEVERIEFTVQEFEITGNLYLPRSDRKLPLIIWVHGSGPDLKTNTFPGTQFFNVFLDKGYAYFRYDKPGSGDSKGEYSDKIFEERSAIVNGAIEKLKTHSRIDTARIGLAGSSQAGYVIPLVLNQRNDIAFMIGLSFPAQSGHEQWSYLLTQQMICDGYDEDFAMEFGQKHLQLVNSKTYEEFLNNAEYFKENKVNISVLNSYNENFGESIEDWWPLDWAETQSFDPIPLIRKIKIPALLIYGEKDTQINPLQGAEAYEKALKEVGNDYYKVIVIPDTDHNMSLAETGCLKEQRTRSKSRQSPELDGSVERWLVGLEANLNQ